MANIQLVLIYKKWQYQVVQPNVFHVTQLGLYRESLGLLFIFVTLAGIANPGALHRTGTLKCLYRVHMNINKWFLALFKFLLLNIKLWKHLTSRINEAFVLQSNCISEEERDAYEELLTQAEIQGNINKVNSE